MYTRRHKLLSSFHKGCILSIWNNIHSKQVYRHKKRLKQIYQVYFIFLSPKPNKSMHSKNMFTKKKHSLFECALFKIILYCNLLIKYIIWLIKLLNFICFCSLSHWNMAPVFLVLVHWWHIKLILLTNKEPLNVINILCMQIISFAPDINYMIFWNIVQFLSMEMSRYIF